MGALFDIAVLRILASFQVVSMRLPGKAHNHWHDLGPKLTVIMISLALRLWQAADVLRLLDRLQELVLLCGVWSRACLRYSHASACISRSISVVHEQGRETTDIVSWLTPRALHEAHPNLEI